MAQACVNTLIVILGLTCQRRNNNKHMKVWSSLVGSARLMFIRSEYDLLDYYTFWCPDVLTTFRSIVFGNCRWCNIWMIRMFSRVLVLRFMDSSNSVLTKWGFLWDCLSFRFEFMKVSISRANRSLNEHVRPTFRLKQAVKAPISKKWSLSKFDIGAKMIPYSVSTKLEYFMDFWGGGGALFDVWQPRESEGGTRGVRAFWMSTIVQGRGLATQPGKKKRKAGTGYDLRTERVWLLANAKMMEALRKRIWLWMHQAMVWIFWLLHSCSNNCSSSSSNCSSSSISSSKCTGRSWGRNEKRVRQSGSDQSCRVNWSFPMKQTSYGDR